MAKPKHRTTKRGTQKHRASNHDQYLHDAHPAIWQRKVGAEWVGIMGPKKAGA